MVLWRLITGFAARLPVLGAKKPAGRLTCWDCQIVRGFGTRENSKSGEHETN